MIVEKPKQQNREFQQEKESFKVPRRIKNLKRVLAFLSQLKLFQSEIDFIDALQRKSQKKLSGNEVFKRYEHWKSKYFAKIEHLISTNSDLVYDPHSEIEFTESDTEGFEKWVLHSISHNVSIEAYDEFFKEHCDHRGWDQMHETLSLISKLDGLISRARELLKEIEPEFGN